MNFQFNIKYCPGKWHRGPDALSRNPINELQAIIRQEPTQDDVRAYNELEDHVLAIQSNALNIVTHNIDIASLNESKLITIDQIQIAAENDPTYQDLLKTVSKGFPKSKNSLRENIREFWEVRDRLSSSNNLVLLNRRIVIPQSLRRQVLDNLHAAHQGFNSMSARANQAVYWPGMNASIRNHRLMCHSCNQIAPSQPSEPLIESPSPEWPFQQICTDYFETEEQSYLVAVDRFSCWIEIFHFPSNTKAELLIKRLRQLFITFGVPEEISSDGGPQFTSSTFDTFLKQWGIHHRISSASYPQSNGRAELAVKSAKRIILNNTIRGSLDNDRAARALLQHRNTPLQGSELSPSQILFHRQLRDHIPTHSENLKLNKKWLLQAKHRERKNATLTSMSNGSKNPRNLPQLQVGDQVLIHDPPSVRGHKRWIRTGRVVETLPYRQYRVRMEGSGRVSLRNRKFLKINPNAKMIQPNITTFPPPQPTSSPTSNLNPEAPPFVVVENPRPSSARIPRALKQLMNFNKPGLKE